MSASSYRSTGYILSVASAVGFSLTVGCASHAPVVETLARPDVTPAASRGPSPGALSLDASQISPMYTELMAIDLPSVVGVAAARNFDILHARQAVEASRGGYESAIGSAFPVIVPTALFEHVEGSVRATEGSIVSVGFDTFQPSVAIQWIVNPGRVIHQIIAAKKRLQASEYESKAVELETLRRAVGEFYGLVLAQASVAAAHKSVLESEELLRISQLRRATGVGVPADEMRARARLAERQQDMIIAMRTFYDASVALALTLHLDSSVTLIPSIEELPPMRLVREDLAIGEMLDIAMSFHPALQGARAMVQAAMAEKSKTWWGGFGPTMALSYQYGGITGHANNVVDGEGVPGNLNINPFSADGSYSTNPMANGLVKEGILRGSRRLAGRRDQTYSFSDQQRGSAGMSWQLGLAIFGDMKVARARGEQALLGSQRVMAQIEARVVRSSQETKANDRLISLAEQQVAAAEEALRLSEVNLRAGTMTTLDVLQGQDSATQARLRYADSVVRFNQSQVNLLAALGLLDSDTILTPSSADQEPQLPQGAVRDRAGIRSTRRF